MIRFLCATGAVFLCVSTAFAKSPTTGPTTANSLTPQQIDDLHREAVELMCDGKYSKAEQVFDRAYDAVPAAQRSRPLVLNRAILDLMRKSFIMRGVRDLNEYLTKHRGEDELATNVLGAALNVAAEDPRLKSSAAWQAAYREWDRRNYLLDHSRAGWRRWGTRWISDADTKARETQVADLRKAIDDQSAYIARLTDDAYS